jgi:ATP-binding cassette subfamily F protein 3
MANPTILTVSELAKNFGSEQIFSDVSFQLAEREHAAIVGVNGAGKSTLMRIIAGVEEQQKGVVSLASGARLTYLAQETRFSSERTVREEARLAFADALAAADRMREIEQLMASASGEALDDLLHEYDRLHVGFETAGGYDVEHRTDEVLMGLGFTFDQFDQPVNQLSGGQKTRVALAKALLASPDLLLLDEPTNHLDLTMVEWLEEFLRSWNGACLIISHDRYFLDRVTTRTLDMAFGRLEDYPAGYARYLVLREERMKRRLQEYEEQQAFIARTEEFVRKYKAGQRSREARGRQTRLDRLERIERPQEHEGLNLKLSAALRSGREVLRMTPLQVGYKTPEGNTQLLQTPELMVERGDRVALVGPNGCGKSTLLRTLIGELEPLKGRVMFGANVKLGYYAQGHERLPSEGTPLGVLLDTQPMGEESARTYLGRFLFSEDDVFKRVGSLSGGERSRLALACLLLQQANFLVLDEPTNHLDIHTRETLEEMLREFDGTVLFVSHDRFFIDQVATRVWAVQEGMIRPYLGHYTDYQRQIARKAEPPKAAPEPADPEAEAKPQQAPRRARGGEAQAQKALTQAEREIAKLEGRLNELSDALAVASIDADLGALERLGAEYERIQDDLEAAYARWEELTAQVELAAAT